MIDWNKKIKTKHGLKARVIYDKLKSEKSIVIAIENKNGVEFVVTCYNNGDRGYAGDKYDIVNIVDSIFVNWPLNGFAHPYNSRAEADDYANTERTHCIEITPEMFEKGEL